MNNSDKETPEEYLENLSPTEDISDTAIDWFMAVRKFGIVEANRMFPS